MQNAIATIETRLEAETNLTILGRKMLATALAASHKEQANLYTSLDVVEEVWWGMFPDRKGTVTEVKCEVLCYLARATA